MNMRSFGQEEILCQINMIINDITGGDCGIIVNLRNVAFNESCRSNLGSSTLAVSNLFINDGGRLCADIYRSGSGGFFEFICGMGIEEVGRRGLDEILYALRNDRWTLSEQPRPRKKPGNRKFLMPIRMPFHLKGA